MPWPVGTGLEQLPFFLLAGEQTRQEHPHLTLLGGVVLVPGRWAGPGLGKGQAALPWAGCHQAAAPPHLTPSRERNRSITEASFVTATHPWPRTPPPSVTLTSGSEPCSDQITMMSIWGWVGKGGEWEGMEPTFSVFCIVCFLQHVTNQYLVNIVSRSIDLTLVFLVFLWQFIRPYISSLF